MSRRTKRKLGDLALMIALTLIFCAVSAQMGHAAGLNAQWVLR